MVVAIETEYIAFGFNRSPALRVHTTATVPSAAALPATFAPVATSVTVIASAVTDDGSIDGVNAARMFVVSATSFVTAPAVSVPCDGGSPFNTVTAPRTGGCATRLRSTRITASGSTCAECGYGTPSPVCAGGERAPSGGAMPGPQGPGGVCARRLGGENDVASFVRDSVDRQDRAVDR